MVELTWKTQFIKILHKINTQSEKKIRIHQEFQELIKNQNFNANYY